MAEVAAIASLAVGAYGTAKTMEQQKKAVKAQEKAREAQKRIADIRSQRERTQMIREARIRRAQIMQSGVNSGITTDSSPVLGGVGSVQSQLASGVAANQQTQSLGQQASDFLGDSAKATQKANEISALTEFGVGLGQQFGSFDPKFTKTKKFIADIKST